MPENIADNTEKSKSTMQTIDWILICAVSVVLISLTIFLLYNLHLSNQSYDTIIQNSLKNTDGHQDLIAYSRAKDFNNMKSVILIVGFLLIFIGAMYLLKVFNLTYKLGLNNPTVGKVDLQTTSPGLVMVTLGVILNIAVLMTKTEVNIDSGNQASTAYKTKVDSMITALGKKIKDDSIPNKKKHPNSVSQDNTHDLKVIESQLKTLLAKPPIQSRIMTHDT